MAGIVTRGSLPMTHCALHHMRIADEFDGGEIVSWVPLIAGGDAAELCDPVEEAFDEVALAIKPGREPVALLAV